MVPAPTAPFWKRPAVWALTAAALLAMAGAFVAWWLPNAAPLHADVRIDREGREALHVRCASCPDGTRLIAQGTAPGATGTSIKGHEADVLLGQALKVGGNQVTLKVDRLGNGRDETVLLDVPLAYRIAPDLQTLQRTPPTVGIAVEAVAGSTVLIQNQPVPLDGNGRGRADLDVHADLVGAAAEARTLERVVSYAVTPARGKTETGALTVRVGIVPLVVEVPGPRVVTDAATFPLAGKTAKDGAMVTVGGQPLNVKPDGSFSQLLGISATGHRDIEIRAAAPPLAPRTVHVNVTRVTSLAEEGRRRQGEGGVGYMEIQNNAASAPGKTVAWKAEVIETNVQGPRTMAVVDVRTGCTTPPCLARVALPAAPSLTRGTVVSLFGIVAAMVTVRNASVPDIALDFFLPGP